MRTTTENVTFEGAGGGRLVARLQRPEGEPRAHALFAHCFTCSKDLRAAVRIGTALAEEGIAVLRFDFTGLGESEGDFADTNFSSNVADLVAAAGWLREHAEAPRILVGHSLGGAAVLAAAHDVPEVKAVATIGAPCDPDHLKALLAEVTPELEERGEAEARIGGRTFRVKKQLLEDLDQQVLTPRIRDLGRALLVLHAPLDRVVGIDNARCIFEVARHPKSFVSLDDADHLLSRATDADYAGRLIAQWASRYVGGIAAAGPADEHGDEGHGDEGHGDEGHGDEGPGDEQPGTVVVRSGPKGFAQEIVAGGHRLRADEPASLGGTETGPTPYDLLLAGLGACTSMTLRMYANRKGWPLDGVTVRLKHERIHASDCDACEETEGKVERIRRDIVVEGPLDETQRARLLEIAERCPVHRTLTESVRVESRLVES